MIADTKSILCGDRNFPVCLFEKIKKKTNGINAKASITVDTNLVSTTACFIMGTVPVIAPSEPK